jgi:hypothetical protein
VKRADQHPRDDGPPNRLPGLNDPDVEGIDGEHSVVDGAAGADAVVLAASAVVLLGASPGNCTALCGSTDAEAAEALADPVAPRSDGAAPLPVDPACKVDVGTLSGSHPVDVEQAAAPPAPLCVASDGVAALDAVWPDAAPPCAKSPAAERGDAGSIATVAAGLPARLLFIGSFT